MGLYRIRSAAKRSALFLAMAAMTVPPFSGAQEASSSGGAPEAGKNVARGISATFELGLASIVADDGNGSAAAATAAAVETELRVDFGPGDFFADVAGRVDAGALSSAATGGKLDGSVGELRLREARFRFFPADSLTLAAGFRKLSWGYALGESVGSSFPPVSAYDAAAAADAASRAAAVYGAAVAGPFGAGSPAAAFVSVPSPPSLGVGVDWRPFGPDFTVDASVDAGAALGDAGADDGEDSFDVEELAYALVVSGGVGPAEWYTALSWRDAVRARAETGARVAVGTFVLRGEAMVEAYRLDGPSSGAAEPSADLDWDDPAMALRGGVEYLVPLDAWTLWAAAELLWMPEPEAFYAAGYGDDAVPSAMTVLASVSLESEGGLRVESAVAADPERNVALGTLAVSVPAGDAAEIGVAGAARVGEGGPLAMSDSRWALRLGITVRR